MFNGQVLVILLAQPFMMYTYILIILQVFFVVLIFFIVLNQIEPKL